VFHKELLKGPRSFSHWRRDRARQVDGVAVCGVGRADLSVGRREDPLRETCEEIHRTGGSAAYTTCDVPRYGAVEAAAAKAEEQFGEINTLVNNAARKFHGAHRKN